MFAYIVRRILATIPVMVVVAVFVFALLHLSPGDPVLAVFDGKPDQIHVASRTRLSSAIIDAMMLQSLTRH